MSPSLTVVHLGATGAVGQQVVATCLGMDAVQRLTLLGRRPLDGLDSPKVDQHIVDIFADGTYDGLVSGHDAAVCTLGVGQPSKMSRSDFVRIDKDAVVRFARACRAAGVAHFELLGSVGADPAARSFYLRAKGELEDVLRRLEFERLSLFRPSMILTPTNRYGIMQAMTLAVWPRLKPVLVGSLRKYRGIDVAHLGRAIARNLTRARSGVEVLRWDEIAALAGSGR